MADEKKSEGFPKHMYNGKFRAPAHHGDPEPVFKVVNDKDEEKAALASGWKDKAPARLDPAEAQEAKPDLKEKEPKQDLKKDEPKQ